MFLTYTSLVISVGGLNFLIVLGRYSQVFTWSSNAEELGTCILQVDKSINILILDKLLKNKILFLHFNQLQ